MLFNSFQFIFIFLPLVLMISKLLSGINLLRWITLSSFIFYSFVGHAWFILPMLFTICLDYKIAHFIANSKSQSKRKYLLLLSLLTNLGLLFYFKYSILFSSSALNIILPAGISFYTFQTISYIVDVYQEIAEPEYNFWRFASFVSFFPHLVAGPLTRHNQLIPNLNHISKNGISANWPEGIYLFTIGLSKKILIADRLAEYINPILIPSFSESMNITHAWMAFFGFAFQLYFDFSGYSDMAIGLGRLFNIELPQNFNSPYQSKNPQEFWTKWHITLGLWLKDYLFNPLAYFFMSRNISQNVSLFSALMITMTLGGLWHGANWTFAVFGIYHGLLLILFQITKPLWIKLNSFLQQFITFMLIGFGWILFRSENFIQCKIWMSSMFKISTFNLNSLLNQNNLAFWMLSFVSALIIWTMPNASNYKNISNLPFKSRFALGIVAAFALLFINSSSSFLYFQF